MMKRFLGLLIITIALTACGGVSLDGEGAQAEPTSTPIPTAPAIARPTYTVQRGTVQEILEFTGRWQPRDQLGLHFEIAGTVRQVNVRRGDTVSAGDLLADFQITDLEFNRAQAELSLEDAVSGASEGLDSTTQQLEDAEISLANARLSLENTRAGSPWTNLESARLSLEDAQRNLEEAERDYNDALGQPDQPASTVDNARQALENAQSQVESAETSYYSAAQSFNQHQISIQQAENSVVQAEIALDRARTGTGSTSTDQAVRQAQLNLDEINDSIARSSMYAPIDGVILEVEIEPGSQVAAYDTVLTMAIPQPMEIVGTLALSDTQYLSVGMTGQCEVVNQPETAVGCVIRQIPLSSRDVDQTSRIAASLDQVVDIPMNQLIEVEMPLQVREDVLWLPPAAIRTFQNRQFVVLQTPDGPRSVDVQIGLETDDRVEIVSGVSEGDIVEGQ